MGRSAGWVIVAVFAAIVAAVVLQVRAARPASPSAPETPFQVRRLLFKELQPVALANCQLQRFGEPHDGGYVVCANLLGQVRAAYSYGISGYDGWGCEMSKTLAVPVHQYDCFNLTQPLCPGGQPVFHGECIGAVAALQDGRPFDTLANQIARNGDRQKHLVVKMDVEGAEWDSFLGAPDDVLQRIDQLVVEFHGSADPRYLAAVRRLKQYFHVVHLHWNNYACVSDQAPFRSWAYEVLLVNKRLAVRTAASALAPTQHLEAPNDPTRPDCPAQ